MLYPVIDAVRDALPEGSASACTGAGPARGPARDPFPDTCNKQPLAYVGLAAQKNYNSLYLMVLYGNAEADAAFRAEWAATGRQLNMGTSCLRFKTLADVDLDIIARTVANVLVDQYLAAYERARPRP